MAETESRRARVVIVDDEEAARILIREYLAEYPDFDIVAECANGFEAVSAVAATHPDLLFLDVQMPKLDGFEVLELVGSDIPVIFITAHDDYAVRAFEVHAVDYLLKPFTAERFAAALSRARVRIAHREPVPLAALSRDARRRSGFLQRILVRDGGTVVVIPVDALDYAEAQDDYVALHSKGRSHLKQQPLADLADSLDPSRFVRIHRSYLLNLDRLRKIEPAAKDSREAILADGTHLPVSRSGYDRLQALL